MNDPNRLAVQNPKVWGAPVQPMYEDAPEHQSNEHPVASLERIASASTLTDGGWGNKTSQLERWVRDVEPVAPPSDPPRPPSPVDIGERPSSAAPVVAPVTMYVSDDDTATEPSLRTPRGLSEKPPKVLGVSMDGYEAPPSPPPSPPPSSRRAPTGANWRHERKTFWKRPPHPAFSVMFAKHRVMVK
jgi:hypothetical protein